MSLQDEDQWIGMESHLVPRTDPDSKCNGKKTLRVEDPPDWPEYADSDIVAAIKKHNDFSDGGPDSSRAYFKGYCDAPAGRGTDHVGEGRCEHHNGNNPGVPLGNQNAQKHATTADPHHYAEDLSLEEQEFIESTTAAILDRVRRIHGREPDFLDRVLAKQIAIDFHIVSNAADYSKENLVQVIIEGEGTREEKGALVDEVRRYRNSIVDRLKKLGVLEDPETQKANAVDDWRNFLEQGSDSQSQKDSNQTPDQ